MLFRFIAMIRALCYQKAVASRFKVFSCYSLALIGEINVLQRLQSDIFQQRKTAAPYLTAVQDVEEDRRSAIATLIAQVEKRD